MSLGDSREKRPRSESHEWRELSSEAKDGALSHQEKRARRPNRGAGLAHLVEQERDVSDDDDVVVVDAGGEEETRLMWEKIFEAQKESKLERWNLNRSRRG
jgi:hypothetical protein